MKDDNQAAALEANDVAPVMVKKYANRRLYNTATSSYVTLENLAAMARAGRDFVVQDAKTGEDITRSVLTQIIFEEESRGREPLLPTSFLRQLIRLYGHTLQSYVPGYLQATMEAFERNQEAFRSQMERSFGQAPGYAQFEAVARANMELFRNTMEMFSKSFSEQAQEALAAAAKAEEEGEAADENAPASKAGRGRKPGKAAEADNSAPSELDALRRELRAMQQKVEALAGDKKGS